VPTVMRKFYLRFRRESSSEDAAKIVVRHLREQGTIINIANSSRDVCKRHP
jgi:hypothetical protein